MLNGFALNPVSSDSDTAQAEILKFAHRLRRRWLIIVGVTLLSTALGASLLGTKSDYKAVNQILLHRSATNSPSTQTASSADLDRSIANELDYMRSGALRESVERTLDRKTDVTFTSNTASDLITISAKERTADQAVETANAYAKGYFDLRAIGLMGQQTVIQAKIDAIDLRLAEITGGSSTVGNSELAQLVSTRQDYFDALRNVTLALAGVSDAPQIVTYASTATQSGKPMGLILLTFFTLGLLLGIAAAVVVDFLDRRVLDEQDLERLVGVPVVSTVSRRGRATAARDAYRTLRLHLTRGSGGSDRLIAICPLKDNGSGTSVALDLASECAHAGSKVLVVGVAQNGPLAARLGTNSDLGITSVLDGTATLDKAAQPAKGSARISVLTAGASRADASEASTSDRIGVLNSARRLAPLVLVDTSGADESADISAVADDVVLVINRKSSDKAIERAMRDLHLAGGNVVAAVLVPKKIRQVANETKPTRAVETKVLTPRVPAAATTAKPSPETTKASSGTKTTEGTASANAKPGSSLLVVDGQRKDQSAKQDAAPALAGDATKAQRKGPSNEAAGATTEGANGNTSSKR